MFELYCGILLGISITMIVLQERLFIFKVPIIFVCLILILLTINLCLTAIPQTSWQQIVDILTPISEKLMLSVSAILVAIIGAIGVTFNINQTAKRNREKHIFDTKLLCLREISNASIVAQSHLIYFNKRKDVAIFDGGYKEGVERLGDSYVSLVNVASGGTILFSAVNSQILSSYVRGISEIHNQLNLLDGKQFRKNANLQKKIDEVYDQITTGLFALRAECELTH